MANRMPSRLPELALEARIPVGQRCRVNFVLIDYPRIVVGATQTSPDLRFVLTSARGRNYMGAVPALALGTTTPAGGRNFEKSQWVGLVYEPNEIVGVTLLGFGAGPVPSNVSVALLCQLGWGK